MAIVHEEEGEDELPSGLILGRQGFVPSVQEQAKLDEVLNHYSDVISSEPGRMKCCSCPSTLAAVSQ